MGSKKRPFFRFVAADSRYARDGRFIETLGYYNPIEKPAKVVTKPDRVIEWLKNGAQMSETVQSLFRQINLLDRWEKVKAGESGDDIEIKTEIRERKKRKKKQAAAAAQEKPAEKQEEAAAEAKTEEKTEEKPEEKPEETPEEKTE